MFIAAVSDSNGVTGVRLVCKTSEKVIPPDVVSRSDLLQEIRDEQRKVKCDLNWSAACNWVSWDPWEDPGWPANEVCKAIKVRGRKFELFSTMHNSNFIKYSHQCR